MDSKRGTEKGGPTTLEQLCFEGKVKRAVVKREFESANGIWESLKPELGKKLVVVFTTAETL